MPYELVWLAFVAKDVFDTHVHATVHCIYAIKAISLEQLLLELLHELIIELLVIEDQDTHLAVVAIVVRIADNIDRNDSLELAAELFVLLPSISILPVSLLERVVLLICKLTDWAIVAVSSPLDPLRHWAYDF